MTKKKEKECKHSFVKYPPKIGKLKICTKCGFLWFLGDVKFGEHTIKLSGSGNYIETSTTTAPANPISGKIRLYATSGTSLRMRDSTGTETDLAATGTLYNFLTNPGFEILQRGAGPFTASSAFAHDRWQIGLGSGSTISVTDETTIVDTTSAHSLKAVYTNSTASYIRQIDVSGDIGVGWSLRGQTVTFRLRGRTATANALRAAITSDGTGGTTTYSSYHTGGSTFESLDVTVAIPSDATYVEVRGSLEASCTAYLDNATLVIGSTAQTYYPLHPADEWERCQRYYEVTGGGTVLGSFVQDGYQPAAQNNFFTRPFTTRKAISSSTMTVNGTWNNTNATGPYADVTTPTTYRWYASVTAAGSFRISIGNVDNTITSEANP